MDKNTEAVSVEELFYNHTENKTVAGNAIRSLRKAFGVKVITDDLIINTDFFSLCMAKGVGRKTVLLVAEVACDLAGMK